MRIPNWKIMALVATLLISLSPFFLYESVEPTSAEAADLERGLGPDDLGPLDSTVFLRDPLSVFPDPSAGMVPDPRMIDPATLAPEEVELTDLRAEPGPWFGRRVRFTFQFSKARAEWEPFFTRFGPADFVAFEAWGDREYPWDEEVYDHPAGTFFARRGSVVEASLALARPHQRFEAVGVVRDVFLNEPWIEVQSMRRQLEHIPEGTLLHVQQARSFLDVEQWDLALDQLQRAMSAPLPNHAMEALDELVESVIEEQGDVDLRRIRTR